MLTITLDQTTVASFVLQCSVGIVNITVQNNSAIFFHVLILHWHGLKGSVEHSGILNIVPSIEQLICSLEFGELGRPEFLSVFVKEVHECTVVRPSLSKESVPIRPSHVDIFSVTFLPIRLLCFDTSLVHEVIRVYLNVRVNNRNKMAFRARNL